MRSSVLDAHFQHRRLKGHVEGVTGLAWDASGSLLVSTSFDGTTRSWDPHSGTLLQTFRHGDQWLTGIALSADGRRAVIAMRDFALVLAAHGVVASAHLGGLHHHY
jgi:WD40 repeat protein